MASYTWKNRAREFSCGWDGAVAVLVLSMMVLGCVYDGTWFVSRKVLDCVYDRPWFVSMMVLGLRLLWSLVCVYHGPWFMSMIVLGLCL